MKTSPARFVEPDELQSFSGTARWRSVWWDGIWRSVHETERTTLFGHGYGYPLHELGEAVDEDVRTPHNFFYFALGYGGWIGVLVLVLLQLVLVWQLLRDFPRHRPALRDLLLGRVRGCWTLQQLLRGTVRCHTLLLRSGRRPHRAFPPDRLDKTRALRLSGLTASRDDLHPGRGHRSSATPLPRTVPRQARRVARDDARSAGREQIRRTSNVEHVFGRPFRRADTERVAIGGNGGDETIGTFRRSWETISRRGGRRLRTCPPQRRPCETTCSAKT